MQGGAAGRREICEGALRGKELDSWARLRQSALHMLKGLKRLAGGGLLLLEVRGLRREVAALAEGVLRIASALEARNAHEWPQLIQPPGEVPSIEVSYVQDEVIAEFMEIELGLTGATGRVPSEEEVQAEWHRRHPAEG